MGEDKDVCDAVQIATVGYNLDNETGDQEIIDAVVSAKNAYATSGDNPEIVLIGHSGGGVSVGNAIVHLESQGIIIKAAIQIGTPWQKIDNRYVNKVMRIQAPNDIVANYVYDGADILLSSTVFYGINSKLKVCLKGHLLLRLLG